MVGSNDLNKSAKFYDAVFVPLGIKKIKTTEKYIGYAQKNNLNEIEFYVTKPYNKEVATYGNGTMVSFLADSTKAVDDFHASALENGGVNEGLPGIRSDRNYYAYIRDPEGNKICAKLNSKKPGLITTKLPINPIKTAVHLLIPTFSPKKIGDNAVVIKGATKARVRALAMDIIEIE